jgi:hypothetical protein
VKNSINILQILWFGHGCIGLEIKVDHVRDNRRNPAEHIHELQYYLANVFALNAKKIPLLESQRPALLVVVTLPNMS